MWSTDKAGNIIKNPNLRYVKWFDNSVSGVLRGAQFNYPTYEVLNELKTKRMGKTQAFNYLDRKGFKPSIRGQKILFSFNPSIKSNFDWGGYNAVAEWDYAKKGRVTLHATDLRDTPLSSFFKGKNVINYVQAKNISIKTIKKHTDMDTKPKLVEPQEYNKKVKAIQNPDPIKVQTRKELLKSGHVEPGGPIKTIRKDVHKVLSKAEQAKANVKLSKLFKSGTKSKSLLKYARYFGSAGSAVALLGLATMLYANRD